VGRNQLEGDHVVRLFEVGSNWIKHKLCLREMGIEEMNIMKKFKKKEVRSVVNSYFAKLHDEWNENSNIIIKLRSGIFHNQVYDVAIISKLIKNARNAESENQVIIQSAIAVGYVNAMQEHEYISEEEMVRIINMIARVGEKRLEELQSVTKARSFDWIRRKVTS